MDNQQKITLGKISYLNVWPIYYALEHKIIDHELQIVSGPPAHLNGLSSGDKLDISAVSSIEYARHTEKYLLIPDLAIGSRGPVRSVLLLSTCPVQDLKEKTILVSSETHTSAALLKLLFNNHLKIRVQFQTGNIRKALQNQFPPPALLAIGDEALFLRTSALYQYKLDLGQTWLEWTGRPFIFGLWVAHKKGIQRWGEKISAGVSALLASKKWGLTHLDQLIGPMSKQCGLKPKELRDYFQGLVFDLGREEQAGLNLFFKCLTETGVLDQVPQLDFYS